MIVHSELLKVREKSWRQHVFFPIAGSKSECDDFFFTNTSKKNCIVRLLSPGSAVFLIFLLGGVHPGLNWFSFSIVQIERPQGKHYCHVKPCQVPFVHDYAHPNKKKFITAMQ